jgi:hypothetical protein
MDKEQIERLGKQLRDRSFLANLTKTRVKAGQKLINNLSAKTIPLVIEMYDSDDPELKPMAESALKSLKDLALTELLCKTIQDNPDTSVRDLVVKCGYAPKDPSQRSVFFVLTEQFDRYFDLDFEYKYLRAEYVAAEPDLKHRIQAIMNKSGDIRLIEALRPKRKGKIGIKARYSEQEADLIMDIFKRNQKWNDLVTLMTMIPVSSAVKALDILKSSGWKPASDVEANLLNELYSYRTKIGKIPDAPPEPRVVVGPVIGKWIEEGKSSEYTSQPIDELRKKFNGLDPRIAVRALSAIQHLGKITPADIEAARKHPNWLVRIASLVLCDISPEFAFSDAPLKREGGELWIDELAPAILDSVQYRSYSADLNPDQLEKLQNVLADPKLKDSTRKACGQFVEAVARYRMRSDIDLSENIEEIKKAVSDVAIDIVEIL